MKVGAGTVSGTAKPTDRISLINPLALLYVHVRKVRVESLAAVGMPNDHMIAVSPALPRNQSDLSGRSGPYRSP